MKNHSLDSVYLPLKITFGLVPLLAGLDKFFNLLTDWGSYLSPSVTNMLPVSAATFMMIVGAVEMIVGLAILTKFTRLAAYVAMGWLLLISFNLLIAGRFDVAVRDLVLAVVACSLGTVAGLKGLEWLPGRSRSQGVLSIYATMRDLDARELGAVRRETRVWPTSPVSQGGARMNTIFERAGRSRPVG